MSSGEPDDGDPGLLRVRWTRRRERWTRLKTFLGGWSDVASCESGQSRTYWRSASCGAGRSLMSSTAAWRRQILSSRSALEGGWVSRWERSRRATMVASRMAVSSEGSAARALESTRLARKTSRWSGRVRSSRMKRRSERARSVEEEREAEELSQLLSDAMPSESDAAESSRAGESRPWCAATTCIAEGYVGSVLRCVENADFLDDVAGRV